MTNWLVTEKVYKRFLAPEIGGGAPDMDLLRVARANIRPHMRYIGYLTASRNWLAGETLSLRRFRRRRASLLRRLSGRRSMGRIRDGQALVSADQIAPGVSAAAPGPSRGDDAGGLLRRSRLLSLEEALRARAAELGFDLCRIAPASAPPQAGERLAAWLASGAHGDMEWMAATPERRAAPQGLWREARSIILLGANYGSDEDPLADLARRDRGAISLYARRRDYHEVIKGRLKQLAAFLLSRAGGGEAKVFVDTAPVMEKPLAQAAGLGWQGKHTNLVSRRFGSWLFLGSIFTDLTLAPDAPERDHCGSCRKCLDICPTDAFPAPYRLDARRCVAYLTIEHKGPIPRELRAAIGNRVFGCDDCLAVCPWNKFARVRSRRAARRCVAELDAMPLAELAALDDPGFRALFAATPVKRLGHARFLRNVAIAIGNSGEARLAAALRPLLDHPSPVTRGAAVWALARLSPREELASLARAYAPREPDALVCDGMGKRDTVGEKMTPLSLRRSATGGSSIDSSSLRL